MCVQNLFLWWTHGRTGQEIKQQPKLVSSLQAMLHVSFFLLNFK